MLAPHLKKSGCHCQPWQRQTGSPYNPALNHAGDRGETIVRPVQATDDPATIGPVDLVLFCVKLWDVESAGKQIRPLIGSGTAVIPLQNGVDASERLVPILGGPSI
jgi:2-dehydropantoate 2-reductase